MKVRVIPDRLAKKTSPIKYVTENGFSIIRLCEVDGLDNDTARECRFLVRNERGWEREVTVHLEESDRANTESKTNSLIEDQCPLAHLCQAVPRALSTGKRQLPWRRTNEDTRVIG